MRVFNPLFMIIFWIATLYFSWRLYQGGVGVSSWEFHSRLQAGLQAFVIEHLEKNIPNVTDIQFISLWSSYIQDNEIKIFFEYGFKTPVDDQMTQSQLKGWALLNPTSQDIQKSWSIKEIQINKQSIDYGAEAIIISSADSMDTVDTHDVDSVDEIALPDREGVIDSNLSDTKTSTSSTISVLESVSQNSVNKIPSITLKTVGTSTSSTSTSSTLLDLKK